ncbi:hypothetical protein TIFTF001_039693 [Ficus carica]|uniref:Uncharacterized protein n=1 Tax=Ficus carica TaxID=3494 RepID=A0AA88EA90_FICCA|nr:hypothetical protein TIFTF001_039693 [Ficus carica]
MVLMHEQQREGRRGAKKSKPDDLLEVIGQDSRPVGAHGGGAFDGDDQLFLGHCNSGESGGAGGSKSREELESRRRRSQGVGEREFGAHTGSEFGGCSGLDFETEPRRHVSCRRATSGPSPSQPAVGDPSFSLFSPAATHLRPSPPPAPTPAGRPPMTPPLSLPLSLSSLLSLFPSLPRPSPAGPQPALGPPSLHGLGETGGGGPRVGGAPCKLGGRGAGWGPTGEGRGREEKREKGEEREGGVADGLSVGAGAGGGEAGGGSLRERGEERGEEREKRKRERGVAGGRPTGAGASGGGPKVASRRRGRSPASVAGGGKVAGEGEDFGWKG